MENLLLVNVFYAGMPLL